MAPRELGLSAQVLGAEGACLAGGQLIGVRALDQFGRPSSLGGDT